VIRAMLFDLDGTLVQSEKLEARSYAIAVQRLRGLAEPDDRAIEAYREIVGALRDVASRHVMESFDLVDDLTPLMTSHDASEPWQVLSNLRKAIYDDIVSDPEVIRDNQWPHAIGMLRTAREAGCKTALATMSYRTGVMHVLTSLGIEDELDLILTREDVENAKPDPEIYLLDARTLGLEPEDCIVLENSPNGVRAGVAAGMNVLAVATPFTLPGYIPVKCSTIRGSFTIPKNWWKRLAPGLRSTTAPHTGRPTRHY